MTAGKMETAEDMRCPRVGPADHGAGNPAPAGRGPKPEEERPDVTRVRRRRNIPTQRTAPRPAGAVRGRK